jgi:hypothetical protein
MIPKVPAFAEETAIGWVALQKNPQQCDQPENYGEDPSERIVTARRRATAMVAVRTGAAIASTQTNRFTCMLIALRDTNYGKLVPALPGPIR